MKKMILVISLFFPGILFADVPSSQIAEVVHLLDFVRNSNCAINRNGTNHVGEKAVKHIENKYDYFRDDIKSTEDFIKYSASKSTMTGKYYMVTCADKKAVKTQKWLLDELGRYRSKILTGISKGKNTVCTEPRPQICTMQYVPVCATLKNASVKTYASDCSACSDSNVISYKPDAC